MSRGLQPGRYSLRLAADPSPLVGVDEGGVPEQPVVTNGNFRIWIVQKEGNKYILSIEDPEGNWFARDENNNVLGVKGAPAEWTVDGPEGGPYTIRGPGDFASPLAWTVEDPSGQNSPIVLREFESDPTPENQKWYFVLPQPE